MRRSALNDFKVSLRVGVCLTKNSLLICRNGVSATKTGALSSDILSAVEEVIVPFDGLLFGETFHLTFSKAGPNVMLDLELKIRELVGEVGFRMPRALSDSRREILLKNVSAVIIRQFC